MYNDTVNLGEDENRTLNRIELVSDDILEAICLLIEWQMAENHMTRYDVKVRYSEFKKRVCG